MRSGADPVASLAARLVECRADALATARAVVDRQDAEDVVQEAMLRVLRAAGRGAAIAEPRAYVRAVVRQVAVDHLRVARRQPALDDGPEPASPHADPQRAIELRELLEAIKGLPPAQRGALLGTALTSNDQRQLALWLNTTPAGVRQLVRRARRRLRDTVGASLPWLGGRVGELIALTPGSGARSGAVVVAAAAVLAPAVPSPLAPPAPPAAPAMVQPPAAPQPSAPPPPQIGP